MPTYHPHRPVGGRCGHAQIHHDGRADNIWDFTISEAHVEMNALNDGTLEPEMTPAEHAEYMTQLIELMQEAKRGVVDLSENGSGKVLRDVILELKPRLEQIKPAFGREPYLLRVYFGEPDRHERKLLALKIAAKAPRSAGLAAQTQHIEEAISRACDWEAGLSAIGTSL